MAVKLLVGNRSRLNFSEYLENITIPSFWEYVDFPPIEEQQDDLSYVLTEADEIDLLANTFYGDPTLWYVIAVANSFDLPPVGMNPGQTIKIPSPRYILEVYTVPLGRRR